MPSAFEGKTWWISDFVAKVVSRYIVSRRRSPMLYGINTGFLIRLCTHHASAGETVSKYIIE